jgi:hypothetical protein
MMMRIIVEITLLQHFKRIFILYSTISNCFSSLLMINTKHYVLDGKRVAWSMMQELKTDLDNVDATSSCTHLKVGAGNRRNVNHDVAQKLNILAFDKEILSNAFLRYVILLADSKVKKFVCFDSREQSLLVSRVQSLVV